MKYLTCQIKRHRYFLLFLFLFAYIRSVHFRISVRNEINIYSFTPEAALGDLFSCGILFLIILFFTRKWQRNHLFNAKKTLKIFSASLLTYLLVMFTAGLLIAILFNNIERNFNRNTFFLSTFSDLLSGFIYGSFFLSYYYYFSHKQHLEQLAKYNQALAESKISQLKSQLNPHFLFNNLNILDQLIEEDKYRASVFLNEFAEIYRYVLQASDKKLVTLREELDFAEQYFSLTRYKYGEAYQLNIESGNKHGYIVPLTLQILIENAIQHNLGSKESPVRIDIIVTDSICVSNNRIQKKYIKQESGRALNNLKEQYGLLSKTSINIQVSESVFTVTLPIIDPT